MRRTIQKRWVLVALIAGTQLACMLIGEALQMYRLRVELTHALRAQARVPDARNAAGGDEGRARTPAAAIDAHSPAAADRIVSAARLNGLSLTAAVVLVSAVLTVLIVRRYENRLARLNDNLMHIADHRSRQVMRTRDAVIFGLAKLAESRDDDTGEHLERIRGYVELLANELAKSDSDLDEEQIAILGVTSSLHDIGKVGVPDAVLLKAGALTPAERQVIQKHPLIGGDCLMAIRERLPDDHFLDTACEIAFAHHERWDGKGYPFGLMREEIPLTARIVALADVYDALTTRRVYKPAMPHNRATEIILEGSGTQFDPRVVEAFLACEELFRTISRRNNAVAEAPLPVRVPAIVPVAA